MSRTGSHILYVITDLKVGGVPLHLLRLVQAMQNRGHRCTVVSLAEQMPLASRFGDIGAEVDTCRGRGGWDFRVIGGLARIIRATRPDVVHSLLFHANVAARRAARKAGLPADRVICEIQTVEVERRWHLTIDRWTHKGCRFTIGNSPSVIAHLADQARIPRERLRLVCGGIDPAPYRDGESVDRAELGLDASTPILLWVGRLDPVKGLTHLLDAFTFVAAKKESHLLLVGDGPLRDDLEGRIASMGLASHVHLLGTRDDIPQLLKAADVFVFPSRTEGLPNALLEAMAAGCAIVTTAVPGCHDLVTHNDTGLLVPYGDTSSLADAMLSILGDTALATRLGRAAATAVERDWNVERTWHDYAAVYEETVSGG